MPGCLSTLLQKPQEYNQLRTILKLSLPKYIYLLITNNELMKCERGKIMYYVLKTKINLILFSLWGLSRFEN